MVEGHGKGIAEAAGLVRIGGTMPPTTLSASFELE